MFKIYWLLFYFLVMFSFLMFILNRKHLLSILLSLEYIVLMLFILLYLYLINYEYEMFFSMVFLTFSVCEGVLGLSILISLIRTHGNDYFQSFNVLQC